MGQNSPIKYSLILPIYNEGAVLPLLVARIKSLMEKLDGLTETIFVDDGSSDTSYLYLKEIARSEPRFKVIKLSRNFGHQIAISAGMDAASGEAVIVMDADLQDPPEVVLQLVKKWKEGYEIVYAQRIKRQGETYFKKASASLFYRLMQKMTAIDIPADTGDFRLIGSKALRAFKAMPEQQRFVRGMFAWMGFRQAAVQFERPERAAGETKYPLHKMLKLATHGIISFSDKPLRLALWLGFLVSMSAMLFGLYIIGAWMMNDTGLVSGWSSTITMITFLCGVNLMMIGIVGLYVGNIYNEVKQRPLYLVEELKGFEPIVSSETFHEDNFGSRKQKKKYSLKVL